MIRSTLGIAILLCLLGMSSHQAVAQDGTETRIYDVLIRGNASPGYYLLAPTLNTNLNLVDHGGWLVHRIPATSAINLQRHADGTFTYFVPRVGHIRMDSTLTTPIDTINSINGSTDFHEVRILRNGNYLVLAAKPRTVDMSAIVEGGKVDALVGDALLEEQRADGTVVWSWNSKDHTSILDATSDIELKGGTVDYIHVNSVIEDTDGNLLISARHFDEIIKIDRSSGAIKWRLGGKSSKHNQFRWLNDTVNGYWGFSHQHTISRTTGGRLLLFDNGNLKTPEYSRAVEYEIDEAARTIRRVWQYRPAKDIAARTMGSVERMPNGGTLICWGRNFDRMILTELDSNDNVVYELKNTESTNTASYRAAKYPVKMLAERFRLSAAGVTHAFRANDAPIGLTIKAHRVVAPRSITVERHQYRPLGATFEVDTPTIVDPVRWSIRHDLSAADSVTMRIDLRDVPAVRDVGRAVLWHRPLDGIGKLRRLTSVVDTASDIHTLPFIPTGEICVGYDVATRPQPVRPVGGQSTQEQPAALVWTSAFRATAYDVQVATDSTFATPVIAVRTTSRRHSATDTLHVGTLQPARVYHWRVRAAGIGVDSGWSDIASFKTALDRPTIVEPALGLSIPAEHVRVVWTSVPEATAYEVRMRDTLGNLIAVLRTGDTSVVLAADVEDTLVDVDVSAERGDLRSYRPAQVRASILPRIPRLCRPSSGTNDIELDRASLSWVNSERVRSHIQVLADGTSQPIVDDTITTALLTLPSLAPCTLYQWRLRSVGRQGASAWTSYLWFATQGVSQTEPVDLDAPADGATVDASNVELRWSMGANGTTYRVQIDTTPAFADVVVDTATDVHRIVFSRKLPEDRPLYWRVYASPAGQCGTWSAVRQFTIPGLGLGPLSPKDGETQVPISGKVRYTTSNRYVDYRVEFFPESGGAEPEKIYTSVSNECLYLNLQPLTWYRWHVLGVRQDGQTDVGPWARFRTNDPSSSVADTSKGFVTFNGSSIMYKGEHCDLVDCAVIDIRGNIIPIKLEERSVSLVRWSVSVELANSLYVTVLYFGGYKSQAMLHYVCH